ncbi:methyltransferase domain-containing protein [Falsiroseomonas sp.]|uniref:methyltransferase domain-containing protein n=1 Tax=Falsiroseomonas sp. TaxID=2870721 RepID=UPI003F717BDB
MKLPNLAPQARLPVTERWADATKTFGHANPQRAREVADKLIAFGIRSVLDIGCGNMKLREHLAPKGIGYIPADVVQRSPECLVVNLDTDPVPRCDAECVVMVGVLEFLTDAERVLAEIAEHYERLFLTLSPLQTIYEQVWQGKPHTIASTHKSAHGLPAFKRLFSRHFVIEDIDVIPTGQYVLLGRARRKLDRAPMMSETEGDGSAGPGIADNIIDFNRMAGGFETHIFQSVPFHSMFQRTAAMVAASVVTPGSVCIDLGCSTGRFARILRRHFRGTVPVEILGIDQSPEMIEEARRKADHPLTRFICADVLNYDMPESVAFISCLFTLQFMQAQDRLLTLERMHQALDWRGAAVVAEKVLDEDGRGQMENHYLLNSYKRSMGLSDDAVLTKERAVRSAMRPLTARDNKALFAEAGFTRVQTLVAAFGWELYLLGK